MKGSSVLDEHVIGTGWRAHPVPMGETGEEALAEPYTYPMSAAVDNGLVSRSLPYARTILEGRAFVLRRAYIAKEVITGMGVTAWQITAHNEGKPYNKGEIKCREAVGLIVGGRKKPCRNYPSEIYARLCNVAYGSWKKRKKTWNMMREWEKNINFAASDIKRVPHGWGLRLYLPTWCS